MVNSYSKKIRGLYDNRSEIYELTHHLQTLWADTIHRKEVIKHAYLKPDFLILDIGTGTALTAKEAIHSQLSVSVIGIDLSMGMLQQARKNTRGLEINLSRTDAQELPFQDNTFDAVISAYGFGGIQYPKKAMQEVVRVAKPNANLSFAEMSEPPREKYVRRFLHKTLVEPWIRYFWGFRDLDLVSLFEDNNITIGNKQFFSHRILGSTTLVSGTLKK